MKKGIIILLSAILLPPVTCVSCMLSKPPSASAPSRNPTWAVKLDKPELENFHRVDDNLFRGALPTGDGVLALKKMGVRTVISLCSFSSERYIIGETGLAYEHIYMKPWRAEEKDAVRFLQIVTDPARTPVFVHCRRGADRTGTMCAVYRIVVCGWSREEAVKEMTDGGYGFARQWTNLLKFMYETDFDAIKRRAGIKDISKSENEGL